MGTVTSATGTTMAMTIITIIKTVPETPCFPIP